MFYQPGLTKIMANSRDYNELYWAWNGWRNAVSGEEAREDYAEYVTLKNQASEANGSILYETY